MDYWIIHYLLCGSTPTLSGFFHVKMLLSHTLYFVMALRNLACSAILAHRQVHVQASAQQLNRDFLLSQQWCTKVPDPNYVHAIDLVERLINYRPRGVKAGRNRRRPYQPIQTVPSYLPRETSKSRGCDVRNLIKIQKTSDYDLGKNISFSLWNARSIQNKLPSVCDAICDNKTDIFVVTETWMNKTTQKCVVSQFRSLLSDYDIHSCHRTGRKGGGIAAIIRNNLKVEIESD